MQSSPTTRKFSLKNVLPSTRTDMIKFTDDFDKIIPLWQEAFGDSREDIDFFLKNCKNSACLGYFEDNQLLSMLFLVDCKCDGRKAKYIYAACTAEQARTNGCMSELLAYCKDNYTFLCLVPANESLIDFYAKRGFTEKVDINELSFDESDEIKEYLFEGCTLKKPFIMVSAGLYNNEMTFQQ